MSSISTNLSTNSYRSSGLSGLVSGMDTDSMVEKMLQGTQKKIDNQKSAKQRLQWKQTMYQSVIKKINTLKSKYFDSSYDADTSSNLLSSKFFNSMVSTVTGGDSVKVVSSSTSAMSGEMRVLVSQLASASKLTSSVKMSGSQTIEGTAMDIDAIKSALSSGEELSFDVTLDGVTKSLTFSSDDFSGEVTADTIKDALDTKLSKAFGSYVGVNMTDSKLSFFVNIKDAYGDPEEGHALKITGADAADFGIEPGSSSLLQTTTKLGDISGVSGKGYSFTINGEQFNFSADDTVGTMMKTINSSNADVQIAYSSASDTFSMTSTSTGSQYGIDITQESGNLLSVMFGSDKISGGASATSRSLNTGEVAGTALADDYTTTGASMKFNVNGQEYTFTLEKRESPYTKAEVESELNSWLSDTFGETSGTANISYANGKLTTAAGYLVSFDKTTLDLSNPSELERVGKLDLGVALGFSIDGATNAVTGDTNISDVAGLSGITFKDSGGNPATKLSDIAVLTYGGTDYDMSFADGKLSFTGTGTVDFTGTELETYFGGTVTFGTGDMASDAVVDGTDAKVRINGVETSRSSNTFTFDGVTITATKVSAEETVIGTERDTDKIVDAVKSFVNDYNELVEELYGYITEDADYKDYAPLTDAQKDEMSESEIKNWTEKAKTGLLRSDTNISSFMQSMRSAFYTKVESAGIAAYSIGIETTKDSLAGKLTLDESALRNAIASDPDAVEKLFTDSEDGLATKLSETCDNYAKLSMAGPGALVQLAGAEGYTAYSKINDMYIQLSKINDKLDDLQTKYEKERTRYWNKFNAMESVIAQYSAQSNVITSSLSYE